MPHPRHICSDIRSRNLKKRLLRSFSASDNCGEIIIVVTCSDLSAQGTRHRLCRGELIVMVSWKGRILVLDKSKNDVILDVKSVSETIHTWMLCDTGKAFPSFLCISLNELPYMWHGSAAYMVYCVWQFGITFAALTPFGLAIRYRYTGLHMDFLKLAFIFLVIVNIWFHKHQSQVHCWMQLAQTGLCQNDRPIFSNSDNANYSAFITTVQL